MRVSLANPHGHFAYDETEDLPETFTTREVVLYRGVSKETALRMLAKPRPKVYVDHDLELGSGVKFENAFEWPKWAHVGLLFWMDEETWFEIADEYMRQTGERLEDKVEVNHVRHGYGSGR